MTATNFYPYSTYRGAGTKMVSSRKIELILEKYFQKHVVVFSSGRAALRAFLELSGAGLYRSKIKLPSFMSACVVKAVSDFAFPVMGSRDLTDFTLLYHQYGFVQKKVTLGREKQCIRDNAHAFFNREADQLPVILSFSKFFDSNFGGALVLADNSMRKELDTLRKRRMNLTEEASVYKAFDCYYKNPSEKADREIQVAYEKVQQYPAPLSQTWERLYSQLLKLDEIKERRREIVARFAKVAHGSARGFIDPETDCPFFFPCSFTKSEKQSARLMQRLRQNGVGTGLYNIDVKRNQFAPDYKKAVVVPCHQGISEAMMRTIEKILGESEE